MQPTRALMDGVLKYKTLHGQFKTPPANHFLYDSQKDVLKFVFDGATFPRSLPPGEKLNRFKSVECQIMDWADDAAYSLNDIVDGVKTGFLTIDRIQAWADAKVDDALGLRLLDELLDAIRTERVEGIFSARIGAFITGCRLRERDNFMASRTNRYRYELVVAPEAERQAMFYKTLANDIIFESPQLQQMEHKARKVLFDLWDSCWRNYVEPKKRVVRILPPAVGKLVDGAKGKKAKARQICDWLAGLTDGTIVRTYRRLFGPEFGSIRDMG
jgi:dGTPase